MGCEELTELILESTDSLYRVARGILKSDADCEDAVSEAIVKAYEHLSSLRDGRYAKTWLIRILINECFALLRNGRRIISTAELPEAGQTVRDNPEEHMDLYLALQKLEEKYRVAVILYYIEGFSAAETAKIMGAPVGTVKSWLYRGRRQLKSSLEKGVCVI